MASSRAFGRVSPDMQLVVNTAALPAPSLPRTGPPPRIPANAAVSDKKLFGMRVDKLREAIRGNQVSFPSQIPTFSKHTRPDLQRKLVQLYFVCGWSGPKIRKRYGLGAQRFQQILSTWKNRAIELGYIQVIPPDQMVMLSSWHLPIRVALTPAANGSSAPALSPINRFRSMPIGHKHARNGHEAGVSCRPRRKCDSNQIAEVLKHLQAGQTVSEIANEIGVTASTIRAWERQHEIRLLRRENWELKERLAKLGAIEKTDQPH
jgi:transposase